MMHAHLMGGSGDAPEKVFGKRDIISVDDDAALLVSVAIVPYPRKPTASSRHRQSMPQSMPQSIPRKKTLP